MTWIIFSYLLAAVCCTVLSHIILKIGFVNIKLGLNLDTLKLFFVKPFLIFAIIINITASLCWAKTIVSADISIAIPIYISLVFIANFVVGGIMFSEKISVYKIIGLISLITGAVIIFNS